MLNEPLGGVLSMEQGLFLTNMQAPETCEHLHSLFPSTSFFPQKEKKRKIKKKEKRKKTTFFLIFFSLTQVPKKEQLGKWRKSGYNITDAKNKLQNFWLFWTFVAFLFFLASYFLFSRDRRLR